ncbi:MAG: class I SAM-dependent methyltransferase [Candidatus Nitrospinota bacterium M3_3B_026]
MTIDIEREIRDYWEQGPPGPAPHEDIRTREQFEKVAAHRYSVYRDMFDDVDFSRARGKKVLEVGCGAGTDSAQFARAGADVTSMDLTSKATALTKRHFEVMELQNHIIQGDAQTLPFASGSFDIAYSMGVLLSVPRTDVAVKEIHRVLKPGGEAIVMLYHRDSMWYYYHYLYLQGVVEGRLKTMDKRKILEETVEQRPDCPLAKVYSRKEAEDLFEDFSKVEVRVHNPTHDTLPLTADEINAVEDEEIRSFLRRAAELAKTGDLASETGFYLLVFAVK